MSFLGQILVVQAEMRTTVDKRNYEKGPVPFDGATRRAIVDVIPTYLRQIASAVTGKEEMVFDYDQGVYRSLSSVQKEHKDDLRRAKLTNTQKTFLILQSPSRRHLPLLQKSRSRR